jgi:hypothetical protein
MIITWKSPFYLARSIVSIIYNLLKGRPLLATPELEEKRTSICKNCCYHRAGQCTICGCFISLKAALYGERCANKKAPLW